MAMHDCDLMICIGARFDDRITGRLDAFSPIRTRSMSISTLPRSTRTSGSIVPIVGDADSALEDMIEAAGGAPQADSRRLEQWWKQIDGWRGGSSATSRTRSHKPQYAIERLLRADQGEGRRYHHRSRPAPDVGGTVFRFRRAEPLDDIGRPRHHGLWPAGRHRRADRPSRRAGHRHRRRGQHPDEHSGNSTAMHTGCRSRSSSSTINIWAWCASGRNCCMAGAIRESYSEALPDFVKLAEAYGAQGHRARSPAISTARSRKCSAMTSRDLRRPGDQRKTASR